MVDEILRRIAPVIKRGNRTRKRVDEAVQLGIGQCSVHVSVSLRLSGRIEKPVIAELEKLFECEKNVREISLDLKDVV